MTAETVVSSVTCVKARAPHLLIRCEQPPAGDAKCSSQARSFSFPGEEG